MLEVLREQDPRLVEIPCGRGSVLIPPSLCGRIFCQMDGELIHRLDSAALRNPSATEYDNLGGNSLWPAPEGGPFAFNYLPGSDAWTVQDGICKVVPSVAPDGQGGAQVEKRISLWNRKGVCLDLNYRRVLSIPEHVDQLQDSGLDGMAYHTEDIFEPCGEYSAEEVLLAPWSLEQFPGAEGIVAFGKLTNGKDALNLDFYGDPSERIRRKRDRFTFQLGGEEPHQIGVNVRSQPQFIGAFDPDRSLLVLRKTQPQPGVYFNIADNDQPEGPFSATDLYSIFNGGEQGFFELETIGAMQTVDGRLTTSVLSSTTWILRGKRDELMRYLTEQEGLNLDD